MNAATSLSLAALLFGLGSVVGQLVTRCYPQRLNRLADLFEFNVSHGTRVS